MNVVLTIVDTAAIQDYIFASNRMRENLGASFLVEKATGDWVYDLLAGMKSNIKRKGDSFDPDDDSQLKRNELDAQLIYSGGGNTAIPKTVIN